LPATHAELVVRSLTAEAERLMAPAHSRAAAPAAVAAATPPAPLPPPSPGVAASAATETTGDETQPPLSSPRRPSISSCNRADPERQLEAGGFPRTVYDAFPPDGVSTHAGVQAGSLLFDADFESANLRRAVQVGPREYNLVLSCDVNTRGHTQWFLFRVRGMEAGVAYRFHLINLMKPDSLFSSGMRPLMYSERVAKESGIGWTRAADEIAYFMNQYTYTTVPKKSAASKKAAATSSAASAAAASGAASSTTAARDTPMSSYYTLTFKLQFPHSSDTAYVSQCYPYTYTMSQRLNARLLAEKRSSIIRREVLCHSYGGNMCDVLTVTDFSASASELASRKVAVISARVHPGESNASWMMQGLLEAVTADTEQARQLRRSLILKIVPMLNPDGVILGNYRCSVTGVDLNRQWAEPSETSHPTIFHLKRLMKGFAATEQLLLFCDLHGHSRKRNIFAYGCDNARGPSRLKERIFPRLLADCAHFSLGGCSFKVLKSKETTGRVVVCKQLAVANSFTLEASFCGADFGPGAGGHYTVTALKEMGAAFVPALLEFVEPSQARVNAILSELEAQFPAEDDAEEGDADADGGGQRTEGGGDASEKLRRAVGRSRARAPAAAKSASTGGSALGPSASARKKTAHSQTEQKSKKKEKKDKSESSSSKVMSGAGL